MVNYQLQCLCGFHAEAWFCSESSYLSQKLAKQIICPACSATQLIAKPIAEGNESHQAPPRLHPLEFLVDQLQQALEIDADITGKRPGTLLGNTVGEPTEPLVAKDSSSQVLLAVNATTLSGMPQQDSESDREILDADTFPQLVFEGNDDLASALDEIPFDDSFVGAVEKSEMMAPLSEVRLDDWLASMLSQEQDDDSEKSPLPLLSRFPAVLCVSSEGVRWLDLPSVGISSQSLQTIPALRMRDTQRKGEIRVNEQDNMGEGNADSIDPPVTINWQAFSHSRSTHSWRRSRDRRIKVIKKSGMSPQAEKMLEGEVAKMAQLVLIKALTELLPHENKKSSEPVAMNTTKGAVAEPTLGNGTGSASPKNTNIIHAIASDSPATLTTATTTVNAEENRTEDGGKVNCDS